MMICSDRVYVIQAITSCHDLPQKVNSRKRSKFLGTLSSSPGASLFQGESCP